VDSSANWIDNDFCFACGSRNPLGLALTFFEQQGRLCTRLSLGPQWQGWQGVAHGGILAAIMDDLMSNHLFRLEKICVVTAELKTRYRFPVPLERELIFTSWLAEQRGPIWSMKSDCRVVDEPQRVLSSAEARFLQVEREAVQGRAT
jgi:acyl-coenzyme A thioesterase PaaI-like protein